MGGRKWLTTSLSRNAVLLTESTVVNIARQAKSVILLQNQKRPVFVFQAMQTPDADAFCDAVPNLDSRAYGSQTCGVHIYCT